MLDITPFIARFAHKEALKGGPLAYVGNYVAATMKAIGHRMAHQEAVGTRISWGAARRHRTLSFFGKDDAQPQLMFLWAPLPLLPTEDRQVCVVGNVMPRPSGWDVDQLVAAFDLSGKDVLTCVLADGPTRPGDLLQQNVAKVLAHARQTLAKDLR